MSLRRREPGGPALLALVVLLVYANGCGGSFQFDDYRVIVEAPVVHSWAAWWQDLGRGIRPLLKLTYLGNWLTGWGPPGFHLVNLLLHYLNSWLVFRLASRFLAGLLPLLAARRIALLTGLLFAVHPVHTEAVTYICGRSTLLMSSFYLAGLLVQAGAAGAGPGPGRRLAVVLCFLAAMASKETAITFPAALLLWDLGRGHDLPACLRRQWQVWLLAALLVLGLLGQAAYRAMLINGAGLHSLATNALTSLAALFYLLGKLAWPLQLNIDPDLQPVNALAAVWPQLAGLGGLVVVAIRGRRTRPWLALAVGWALLQLVPIYLLVPRQDIVNERQLYLADFPLLLAGACELYLGLKRWAQPAALLLLLALALLTVKRNRDYQNEITLWEATVQVSPGKARVHNNLGYAYELAGRRQEARQQYRAALALEPDFPPAANNLARLLVE